MRVIEKGKGEEDRWEGGSKYYYLSMKNEWINMFMCVFFINGVWF